MRKIRRLELASECAARRFRKIDGRMPGALCLRSTLHYSIGAQNFPFGDLQFALFFQQANFPDNGFDPQSGHVGNFLTGYGHYEMLVVAVHLAGEFGFEQIDGGQNPFFGLAQVESLQHRGFLLNANAHVRCESQMNVKMIAQEFDKMFARQREYLRIGDRNSRSRVWKLADHRRFAETFTVGENALNKIVLLSVIDHLDQPGDNLKIIKSNLPFPEDVVVPAVGFHHRSIVAQKVGRYVHVWCGRANIGCRKIK